VVGALDIAVGDARTVGSLFTDSVTALFVAAVVTGFGFGAAFLGAVATITAGVASGHRAGLLASIFVVGYLAFSIPSIAAGIAVGGLGLQRTSEIYGVVVIVLALGAAALLTLRRRRAQTVPERVEDVEAFAA
jgi:MFS family permease